MMNMLRFDPTKPLLNLRSDMDRLFRDIYNPELPHGRDLSAPPVNIEETENEFLITAELPGLTGEDVKITFQDSTLTLSGEKKARKDFKERNFHRFERRYGAFSRSFILPASVDASKIEASFKDGVLTVHIPKAEESKPKEIQVKVN